MQYCMACTFIIFRIHWWELFVLPHTVPLPVHYYSPCTGFQSTIESTTKLQYFPSRHFYIISPLTCLTCYTATHHLVSCCPRVLACYWSRLQLRWVNVPSPLQRSRFGMICHQLFVRRLHWNSLLNKYPKTRLFNILRTSTSSCTKIIKIDQDFPELQSVMLNSFFKNIELRL